MRGTFLLQEECKEAEEESKRWRRDMDSKGMDVDSQGSDRNNWKTAASMGNYNRHVDVRPGLRPWLHR